MLPSPLHPAIVHFPMALVILLPFFALGALWAISRGTGSTRAWAVPVLVALALVVSAFAALRTGEAEEERVESVISESVLHEHEEAAERFLVLSSVLLLVAAAGLAPGLLGKSARGVATVGAFALVFAGVQVGNAGGELVYRQGAAAAYGEPGSAPVEGAAGLEDEDERNERERERP